jgi:hypothetical protein
MREQRRGDGGSQQGLDEGGADCGFHDVSG